MTPRPSIWFPLSTESGKNEEEEEEMSLVVSSPRGLEAKGQAAKKRVGTLHISVSMQKAMRPFCEEFSSQSFYNTHLAVI